MTLRMSHLLLVSWLLNAACTTVTTTGYGRGEIPPTDSRSRIVAVTQTSGTRVTFDRAGEGASAVPEPRVEGDAVLGTANGEAIRVDLSDARSVWVEEKRYAWGRTLALAVGLAIGVPFLMRRF